MTEMEPNSEQDRVEFAKEAMARDLMGIYGTSYDAARMLVEEMFEKARREKEASQEDTPEEE